MRSRGRKASIHRGAAGGEDYRNGAVAGRARRQRPDMRWPQRPGAVRCSHELVGRARAAPLARSRALHDDAVGDIRCHAGHVQLPPGVQRHDVAAPRRGRSSALPARAHDSCRVGHLQRLQRARSRRPNCSGLVRDSRLAVAQFTHRVASPGLSSSVPSRPHHEGALRARRCSTRLDADQPGSGWNTPSQDGRRIGRIGQRAEDIEQRAHAQFAPHGRATFIASRMVVGREHMKPMPGLLQDRRHLLGLQKSMATPAPPARRRCRTSMTRCDCRAWPRGRRRRGHEHGRSGDV